MSGKSSVIVLPTERLLKCSSETISDLASVVNAGYHPVIEKFNVVLSNRITSVPLFFSDLCLEPETCLMYVMVKDTDNVGPDLKLLESGDDFELYTLGDNYSGYRFKVENVSATIAFHPMPYEKNQHAYEITAFSSFVPHGGIDIFNHTVSNFSSTFPSCNELVARVIVEHNLVSYYNQKLDFEEYNRVKINKDRLHESGFFDSFKTQSDFHIADMRRYIR